MAAPLVGRKVIIDGLASKPELNGTKGVAASFDEAKLVENVRAFVTAVNKAKPAGAKGTYMKKVSLTSTMGPGLKIDLSEVEGA